MLASLTLLIAGLALSSCRAFLTVPRQSVNALRAHSMLRMKSFTEEKTQVSPSPLFEDKSLLPLMLPVVVSSLMLLLSPAEADALEGPLSILAGRSASMLHPLTYATPTTPSHHLSSSL